MTKVGEHVAPSMYRPTPGASHAEMVEDLVVLGTELACFSVWRATQGIYRFDPTLRAALEETSLDGELPVGALCRLPEWCVYLETPGMEIQSTDGMVPLHGTWVWIDRQRGGGDILTLGLDVDGVDHISALHVPLAGTLLASIDSVAQQWRTNVDAGGAQFVPPDDFAEKAVATARPIISMLLYLCAEEPDFGGARPEVPSPTKTRHGPRVFPPPRPRVWDVGVRIGAALRDAQRATGEGASVGARAGPRPHIRRAHWHHFWRGPREGAREIVVRWLSPLLIGGKWGETPAVIHRVEGKP